MHFLLIISNPGVFKHMLGITRAAIAKDHVVTVFFNEESVKMLLDHSSLRGLKADMLACITACEYLDINEEDFVRGARISTLGEVTTLMEAVDRTLFLG